MRLPGLPASGPSAPSGDPMRTRMPPVEAGDRLMGGAGLGNLPRATPSLPREDAIDLNMDGI